MKKNDIIGTLDAWLMSRLSQQPSNPSTQHIILKIVGFLVYSVVIISIFAGRHLILCIIDQGQ